MKVTLKDDMIISLSGDTEVGSLPKGVGLERLRWDGEKVVDLMYHNPLWARYTKGIFSLHAVAVKGSQLIDMTWADRKRLTIDQGVIRLRTAAEISENKEAEVDKIDEYRKLSSEAVELVNNLSYATIDKHIDTVFFNLNDAQRASLNRLYKVVLFLTKRAVQR